jgi:hypothetical protein
MRTLHQPDLSTFPDPEPVSVGDRLCNWLAAHPRYTTAIICWSIYLAFLADRILP